MLQNKYNLDFSNEVISKNIARLTNQMWKLIPMKENNENWKKQLNTVLTEIIGLNSIFLEDPRFLQLLSKLEGLNNLDEENIDFNFYRKTVFENITLLQDIVKSL